AEYRLLLRQDNADLRLTEAGYKLGLVSPARYEKMLRKREDTRLALQRLDQRWIPAGERLSALLARKGESPLEAGSVRQSDLLRRPSMKYNDLAELHEAFVPLSPEAAEQVEISLKYKG